MLPKDAARYIINSVILRLKDTEKLELENKQLKDIINKLDFEIETYINVTNVLIYKCLVEDCEEFCYQGGYYSSENLESFAFCECSEVCCENHRNIFVFNDVQELVCPSCARH